MAEAFGPYELVSVLGRGGMGVVYEAIDTVRGRTVALKVLPEFVGEDAAFKARFRRESRLAARLHDPHIIPIHDFGEIDGRLFIDMRLVPGTDLARLIEERGALPPVGVAKIVSQVASALDAAHAAGLVHRDVKPSNILLSGLREQPEFDAFAYLVDFGVARSNEMSETKITTTGAVGTVAYMSPERFGGARGDARSDIYSLACVLYEMLVGETPFHGDIYATMYSHVNADPPDVTSTVRDLPSAINDVIRKGMAKEPADRYSSAEQMADAARAALMAGVAQPAQVRAPAEARDQRTTVLVAPPPLPGGLRDQPEDAEAERLPSGEHPLPTLPEHPSGPFDPSGSPLRTPHEPRSDGLEIATDAFQDGDAIEAVDLSKASTETFTASPPITSAPGASDEPAAVRATPAVVLEPPPPSHPTGARHANARTRRRRPLVISLVMLALIAGGAGVAVWLAGGNDAAGGGSATNSHSNSLLSTPARSSSSSAISATSAAPAPPINFAASPQTIPLSGFPTVGVLSPDRKKLYIAAESGTAAASTLHIVDTATLKVTNVSTPRPINAISPTADGKSLFLSMSEFADQSGWVAKMDLRTHAMQVVARSTNPEGIALSRDGSLLYFVDDTDFGRIFVVSTTAPFHVSHTLDIGADPHAVVITADGGYVAVDNHGDNTIGVLNTKTNQVTKLKHYAIGLLPESGSTIITTFINGSHSQIVKLDVKTGKVTKIGPASESLVPVATLEVHDRYLYALATQPDYVVTLNVSTGAMTKTALPAKEVAQDLVIDPVTGTGFVIDYNDGGNARGQMLVYRS